MGKKNSGSKSFLKISTIMTIFIVMIGLVVFKAGVFDRGLSGNEGLSGIVSVRGTVKLDDLNLSNGEIKKLNRAVVAHRKTFTQVDLFLNTKDGSKDISAKTILVWAMVLDTNGDCEVRSWSRKVSRSEFVAQVVRYIDKAAGEYEEFKRFPDVKQNFKCLYI